MSEIRPDVWKAGVVRTPLREPREERVRDALYSTFLIMRSEAWRAVEPAWITPTQAAILNVVEASRHRPSISEVARALGCARSTISRSVKNLEYKCYVARVPSRRDRRRVELVIGEPGRLAASWARQWDRELQRFASKASLDAIETVIAGLESVLGFAGPVDRRSRGL
ncbi:MAG: MarR family winged helix-turn-helix transcriptional regulator [Gemmatimonadota bacterium]|nr:MarR family winged helix-turn-helix transcriptional regulator [Gemmatimonadota bacterium]